MAVVVPLGLRRCYRAMTTITMMMNCRNCSCTETPAFISILGNRNRAPRCRNPSLSIILPSTTLPLLLPSWPSSLHRLDHRKRHYQRKHHSSSSFQRTNPLYLNRILFDISEIDDVVISPSPPPTPPAANSDFIASNEHDKDDADNPPPLATVTLPRDDYRTIHVAKILGLGNGETVRAGVVRSAEDDTITTTNNHNNDYYHNYNKEEGVTQNEKRSNRQHQHHLAGLITDEAIITWLPEGKNKKPQPTKNGEPPGSLRLSIPQPPKTMLYNDNNEHGRFIDAINKKYSPIPTTAVLGKTPTAATPPPSCPVSLLLALPRPLQLGRLLPMITQLGIHHLILANAVKVPKDYFGSHILRQPSVLRKLLMEGLAQSGDVQLPKITVVKQSLKGFLQEELETLFPIEEVARVVAHPTRISSRRSGDDDDDDDDDAVGDDDVVSTTTTPNCAMRMTDVRFPNDEKRQLLIAVGPEGGWAEPNELDMFADMGFQEVTLGTRVLRSDVAVVSLLALAHEICASRKAMR